MFYRHEPGRVFGLLSRRPHLSARPGPLAPWQRNAGTVREQGCDRRRAGTPQLTGIWEYRAPRRRELFTTYARQLVVSRGV